MHVMQRVSAKYCMLPHVRKKAAELTYHREGSNNVACAFIGQNLHAAYGFKHGYQSMGWISTHGMGCIDKLIYSIR